MNKPELVKAIAEKSGLDQKKAEKALNAFLIAANETLSKGEEIALAGFGIFSVIERSERTAMNFQTQEKMTIPAGKSVKFKAEKILKICSMKSNRNRPYQGCEFCSYSITNIQKHEKIM